MLNAPDSRARQELVAEALRLLDLANTLPVEPAQFESDSYSAADLRVLRGMERSRQTPQDYVRAHGLPNASMDALIEAERSVRFPVEDRPGSGRIVDVTVRVMIGPERSTVVVRRGREEPVLLHEVRQHGHEAVGIGAAVEAALREGMARTVT